ncbi:unnamed protein product [Effrenium voratum]|nr:unnamed protein product [Effrenium voratum]
MSANTADLDVSNPEQASVLQRMEDSIIFSLIERAQYRAHHEQLGKFRLHQLASVGSNGCLGDWFIYQTECLHSQVRRYEHPTEFAFFGPLPEASLGQAESKPKVLAAVPQEALVNRKLLELYREKMVSSLCEDGEDGNFGSTAVQDVHVLQTMSTRIYFGLFVAESKFRSERATAEALIKAKDVEGLMAFITKPEVEKRNVQRVVLKARAFSQNIAGSAEEAPTYKVNPEYIGTLFQDYIMPLTKDVEVAYLLARLEQPDPLEAEQLNVDWVNPKRFLKFGVQFGLCGDCLAGPDFEDARLKPREAMETFFLEGAVEREARTLPELLALLARGAASAGPGRFKSGRQWRCEERAHGLCTFRVRRCKGTAVHTTTIHLLDLVGAAMSDPKAKRGVQQEDKTLKAVLRVVDALAEGPEYQFRDGKRAARHIPYRDAVATKLLRECFGHGRSVLVAFGAEGFDASLAALELARRHEKCRGEARSCVFDRAAQLREIDEEASQLCSRLGLAWDPDRRLQLSMDASEAEVRLAELRLRRGVVAAWQDWALLRQAPGAAAAAASALWKLTTFVLFLSKSANAGSPSVRLAHGQRSFSGVIVGGGVTGAAMLYQLAKRGVKCVLFEKGELTCGATWHAAGLVTRFHGGNNFRLWHDEGVNLFTKWQKEGTELSFHTPGSVRLIPDQKDYISEAKYQVSKAKIFSGLFECEEHHMISPDEIKEKHPLVSLDGIYGGIYTTGDGHIDPSSVTNAFAERARALGGVIEQKTEVVGLTLLPSKQWEVITRSGGEEKRTVADFVLNCAGLWCDKVGAMAGVRIPSVVLQHQCALRGIDGEAIGSGQHEARDASVLAPAPMALSSTGVQPELRTAWRAPAASVTPRAEASVGWRGREGLLTAAFLRSCCRPRPKPRAWAAAKDADAAAEPEAFLSNAQALDAQVVSLALPALVALCAEPVLSIIDTGFVGRLEDAPLKLGGLGAATSVFDFVFRCYNFLCVVLVPLVAEAVVAQKRGEQKEDPAQIVGRVIGLAATLGLGTCSLGRVAAGYLQIRALALPASLVNTVAIGAFRGHLDTTTPLYVVLLQSVSDVVLNFVFVFGVDFLGIPPLGVEGAAWSTVVSIWLSCLCFCGLLSQRGFVAWGSAIAWPSALKELQPLILGSLSQLIRTLSLQAVLLQFTKSVVAQDPAGLAAAAHQVGIRVWFFALFALDSIAVAAQGLVPVAMASFGQDRARWVSSRLLLWGAAGGLFSGCVLWALADYIPSVFTNDPVVQQTAAPLIALVALLQPLAGVVFTWDGLFQGLSDYTYLALAMAVAALATLALLQIDVLNGSLQGVWVCFSVFLVFRGIGLAWRFWGPAGPLRVEENAYCITEPIPEVKEYHEKHGHQLPVLRDLKGSFYVRDERDGILVGPYESAETMQLAPEEWRKTGMPNEYANFLFEGDVDRLMPHLERAMEILPPLAEVGMKTVLNGPTMWPADGNHLVGPAPEWDVAPNFWLACAESYGIAHSAGLSRYLADWICTGEPPYELKEADPARYGAWATKDWVATKVREAYGMNNHVHYPNENLLGGRPVEPVPNKDIYDVLHAAGCQFGFHNGWESANYFDPQAVGQHGNAKGSFHRPPYQDLVENECRGMASFGGICYWPFAKYHVSGPRAKEFLDRLVPNRLPNVGRCALSYFLTPQGKIGSEVMLVRLAEEKFYVVSYPEQELFDWRWMQMNKTEGVEIENVTADFGTYGAETEEGAFDSFLGPNP